MMNKHYIPDLSLEGVINGKKARELEYTIYAKLKDFSQLESAPERELHEQWRLPLAKDGAVKARLRLINNRRWTMTTKAKRNGMIGCEEVDADIPEDLFNHLREMATHGYKKTRYSFPIPNSDRKWEIDTFMDKSGQTHPWVKIDLEVNDPNDPIPDFNLDVTSFIIEHHKSTTPEQERFIVSLWESEWAQIDTVTV